MSFCNHHHQVVTHTHTHTVYLNATPISSSTVPTSFSVTETPTTTQIEPYNNTEQIGPFKKSGSVLNKLNVSVLTLLLSSFIWQSASFGFI